MAVDVTVVNKSVYVAPRKRVATARRQVISLQSLRESYLQLCDSILSLGSGKSADKYDLVKCRSHSKVIVYLKRLFTFICVGVFDVLHRMYRALAQTSIVIYQGRFTPLGFDIHNLPAAPPKT